MNEQSKKILESFIRTAIGFLTGLIPALMTKNIIISAGFIGICGVISELALPQLINSFSGSRVKNLLALLLVVGAATSISYEVYMRHDSFNYKPGQWLTVSLASYPTVAMHRYPNFNRGVNDIIGVLIVGQQVSYLAASSKKSIRYTVREDGNHFLLAFWRKVKTKDGKVGWVYGAYLKAKK